MSQADARLFFERVAKNEAFRRSVMLALQEEGRDPQQLLRLGGQHGLDFTEAELLDAATESQKTTGEELGDGELEGVAGGTLFEAYKAAVETTVRITELLSSVAKKQKDVLDATVKNIR